MVIFYDSMWNEFGTKRSLDVVISEITNIDGNHLIAFRGACVAQKMSCLQTERRRESKIWLLPHGTLRRTHAALYGEGRDAYRRLQYEILRVMDDEPTFAWLAPGAIREAPRTVRDIPDGLAMLSVY
jgi:hypothetical protein